MEITFDSIAGYKQEKEEIQNIVKMFLNYKEYNKKGIQLPKGLVLYGRPGVGKTLFVKAISNELKRNFYTLSYKKQSYSETLSELHEVFKKAKENKPSIVFIDEIDKIVPSDYHLRSFSSDNSRAILSYLLQAMDGFESSGEIMVIATTNRLKSMDEALIRSGRFDKQIYLSLPDETSRKEIIKYYLDKIDFNKNIDIDELAHSLENSSGADIATIINQTFIEAMTKGINEVTNASILAHIQMTEGRGLVKNLSEDESRIVAIHELGHFFASHHLNRDVKDVSIGKVGNSLGRVRVKKLPDLITKEEVLDEIVILLGGKAAEEVILNKSYLGSRSDLQQAYLLLKDSFASGDFGFEYMNFDIHNIEEVKDISNDKIVEILNNSLNKAQNIINQYKENFETLVPLLMEKKLLTKNQIIREMECRNNEY